MEQTTDTQQILGRIYKITSSRCEGCYIGSTIQPLHTRFSVHKAEYKRYIAGKTNYVSSYEVVQHDDAEIELVHEGVFDTKKDLEKLEGHYIEATRNTVNKRGAGMTRAESSQKYYSKNRSENGLYE